MPHYILQDKHKTPVLIYEAPVDEKTKKVRELFDVDEKTGYPRHYNWRSMSRLGSDYRPEDPFLKFDPYDPSRDKSSKVTMLAVLAASYAGIHYFIHTTWRPQWAKPWFTLGAYAVSASAMLYIQDRSYERQAKKDAICVDYLRKHPERFETIHRPKLREVLFDFTPNR